MLDNDVLTHRSIFRLFFQDFLPERMMKRQQLRQQVYYLQLDTYIDATCASVSLNVIIKILKIFLLLFGQFKSLQGDIPRYSTKNYGILL